MTHADATAAILEKEGRPMGLDEILEAMEAGGKKPTGAYPKATLAGVLSRNRDRFKKTAPATFDLRRPTVEP